MHKGTIWVAASFQICVQVDVQKSTDDIRSAQRGIGRAHWYLDLPLGI